MKKLELVFIPVPGFGHLTSPVEFAKRLLDADGRFSVTVFLILPPSSSSDLAGYTNSLAASDSRIKYTIIPSLHLPSPSPSPLSVEKLVSLFIENHKPQVEKAISDLLSDESLQLAGLIVDMFCTSMIDVANKFHVPSYIFFPSNTAFLGFLLHLPVRGGVIFDSSDPDSVIPSYAKPVPADALPGALLDKDGGGFEAFLDHGTRFRETKGIIVNSFSELEPYAVNSVMSLQRLYPVGPLIDLNKSRNKSTEIMSWLDGQPPKSVLFLCFGSMGSFHEPQLEQIAIALERSGQRFLWSVRRPPPKDTLELPSDYNNVEAALPDGFMARTKGLGFVCGWAPQVQVLAHEAVKGFVSHCGWNSILESLWYGVPIATWPLQAEQQLNAFLLVRELGLAVELTLSYRSGQGQLVTADHIEKAIKYLMDDENPVRERVKDMSEKSRKALINGGSSFVSLGKLIQDFIDNIAIFAVEE